MRSRAPCARRAPAVAPTPWSLIGHLAFGLLTNENLLIYILMVLLQTDEPSAAIVFSVLNTMRARLDLVSRLAWIRIGDRATRRAFEQVVKLFNRANQIRSEFLHAIHTMEGRAAIAHEQSQSEDLEYLPRLRDAITRTCSIGAP